MDKRLFRYTMISVGRRRKEVLRTCVAAFLAVFFVTGILIFEENMYEWQVASNKDRFGNWFVMEANVQVHSEYLQKHPKLDGYTEAYNAVTLYDSNEDSIGSRLGYMTPEFLKMGCINVLEGRMPKADNEVAMDWNTLINMGITDPKVGQTVTINYYEGNLWDKNKDMIQEDMKLVGILEDYSNVWYRCRYLPGALVTKKKYESFNYNSMTVYIYKLNNAYRNSDYRAIYQEILSGTDLKPSYNMYVYDFKPWNSENVYNYMYVLVMVIGIAALTYQLQVYNNSRAKSYELMGKLGASKSQIGFMAFTENALILIPAGLLGILGAAIVGWIICTIIGLNMGVTFYYIELSVLLKGLLAIVIAVLVELVISRVITIRKVLVHTRDVRKTAKNKPAKVKVRKFRNRLTKSNAVRTISFRFTSANRIAQNMGVRIFSLGVCVVIIMCSLRIYDTYVAYEENKDNIDLIGTFEVENNFTLDIPVYISCKADGSDGSNWGLVQSEGKDFIDYIVNPTREQRQSMVESMVDGVYGLLEVPDYGKVQIFCDAPPTIVDGSDRLMSQIKFSVFRGAFYNEPRTNITQGITDNVKKNIESINGVESILYGTYESQRSWLWEGMSLEKMGYDKLNLKRGTPSVSGGTDNNQMSIQPYASRDIFGTEYVTPTRELYDRLCKYIEPDMQDYDAFARGDQVLVLLEENPYGEYDDTLKAGDTIDYGYYQLLPNRYNGNEQSPKQYIFNNDEGFLRYMVVHGIQYNGRDYELLWGDTYRTQKEILSEVEIMPCVQTKAAAVVHITDEIRKEFADVLANKAYYMAVASTELARKACESQDEIMARFLEIDISELPDDCKTKMVYNQIIVKYNLLSTISATDNILSTYCQENGMVFTSYAAVNEQYRTDFINAILQYGITIIAVIVINMLICAVIARNRLETRAARIQLLLRLGARKKDVEKVFMIEAFRESLWCLFTLPIVLLIQGVIYKRDI